MSTDPALPTLDRAVDEALDAAADALRDATRVAVACHIGPDGDALGSILAVALSLGACGKRVTAGWDGPSIEVPAQYAFLPGTDLLVAPDAFAQPEVALAIDCASADRLGSLREPFESARVLVNLDHHVSNTRFGTHNVVDVAASSSSELVLHLLLRLGAPLTTDVATCLYTGVVTDTGRFSYAAVTPRTHAVAAFLIDRGVAVDTVAQAVFESLPYGYLKILGRALERCRLLEDPPVVVSFLTQADLRDAGISMDETEEIINVLRSTREADAAAVLKEQADGDWKVSLRSKGAADVGAVAQAFGGGGHRLAAGFTSADDVETTIHRVHQALAGARG